MAEPFLFATTMPPLPPEKPILQDSDHVGRATTAMLIVDEAIECALEHITDGNLVSAISNLHLAKRHSMVAKDHMLSVSDRLRLTSEAKRSANDA